MHFGILLLFHSRRPRKNSLTSHIKQSGDRAVCLSVSDGLCLFYFFKSRNRNHLSARRSISFLITSIYRSIIRPIYKIAAEFFKSKPKDFTFDDAESLLNCLDYIRSNKGKTSGSRVIFSNEKHGDILLHKLHPQKELKAYQIKQLLEILEQEGLI